MRVLYGRHFEARYIAVADEIPAQSKVVDVCAGDCYLYVRYLCRRSVTYTGLDVSPQLVRWARTRGVSARQFDAWTDPIPVADVVVMQASLYQFLPSARDIVGRMLAAGRDKVIISEPVWNLSESHHPVLAAASRYLTDPRSARGHYVGQRFDRQSLTELFQSFDAFQRSFTVPGGKDIVGVFAGQAD